MQNTIIKGNDVPSINPTYVFRWEETQNAYMLMYPEGLIKLNGPAGYIMKEIDGKQNVEEIILNLQKQFDASDQIVDDIYAFMETAIEQGWIKL